MKRSCLLTLVVFGCAGSPEPELRGEYRFEFESALRIGDADGGFLLRGVLRNGPNGFDLTGLRCTRGDGSGEQALAALCRDLEGFFPVKRNPVGTVEQIGLPAEAAMESTAALRYLASRLQLTRATFEAGTERAWTAVERDSIGPYHAQYSTGDGLILRSKNRYLDGTATVDGATEFYLSGATTVRRVASHERVERPGGPGVPDSEVTTRLELSRVGDALPVASRAHAVTWQRLDAQPSDSAQQRAVDERRVRGLRYEQLRQTLGVRPERAEAEARRRFDQASLALVALIRVTPETADRIVHDCAEDVPWCRTALGALGAAGSTAAQRALVRLYRALKTGTDTEERASLRRQAVRALGTRLDGIPSAETVRLLTAELADGTVGTQAAYGLGALGGSAHRAGNRQLSERCLAPLYAGALQSTDRHRKLASLRALSNARVPEVAARIEPLFADPDTPVAAAAIGALYGLPFELTGDALAEAMHDPRDAVRHAAVKVVATSDEAVPPHLSEALQAITRSGDPGLAPRLASKVLRRR